MDFGNAGSNLLGEVEVPLRLRGAQNLTIDECRDELLRRLFARGPVAPRCQHSALHLSRFQIVLKRQQAPWKLGCNFLKDLGAAVNTNSLTFLFDQPTLFWIANAGGRYVAVVGSQVNGE